MLILLDSFSNYHGLGFNWSWDSLPKLPHLKSCSKILVDVNHFCKLLFRYFKVREITPKKTLEYHKGAWYLKVLVG